MEECRDIMRQPPSWPEAMRRSGESHIAVHPAVGPQESLEARRGQRVRGLSIPANFLWSLTGNVTYALTQWGIVIALAKWTNAFMIGQFSLGLAIATPVLMFTNLQLRVVQASDARRLYSFGEYLGLRMVTTLMGLVVIAVIAFASGYHPRTAMVILAVGAAKAVESLSDAYYGLFQLDERLDRVGKSMMLKGVASMAGLCSGLLIGKDVLWGVEGLIVAWLATFVFFDTRQARLFLPAWTTGTSHRSSWLAALRPRYSWRQLTLVRTALPLGIVMTLVSLNLHIPRYFVQVHQGEEQLGVFSAIAYMSVAIATVGDALAYSATPQLSRLFLGGRLVEFQSMLERLLLTGAVLALAGVAAAAMGGSKLLVLFYGARYGSYGQEFVWLMIGGGVGCIASLLNCGITAARFFRLQVPIFALVVATNAFACSRLVPAWGLKGAAIAPLVAAVVHLVLAAAALVQLISGAKKIPAGSPGKPRSSR